MMSIQEGKPNLKQHSTLNMREAVIRLEVKYTSFMVHYCLALPVLPSQNVPLRYF